MDRTTATQQRDEALTRAQTIIDTAEAENRDLTVLAAVGAGAEVIADGSIHIYGALRGRALAGAQGNEKARIFCREFHAELVAVAGHYKVLDEIPKDLLGKPAQVWLDNNGQLNIAALD